MPRIRNNTSSSSAAAVFDTASVAYTHTAAAVSDTASVADSRRRPLHPASQGPLSPQAVGVFDTSIAVAARRRRRRVTVSDTVAFTIVATRAQVTVSDTVASTVVATRAQVTVSDTVAAVFDTATAPSLKRVFKYSANNLPRHDMQTSALGPVNETREECIERARLLLYEDDKSRHDSAMEMYANSIVKARIEVAFLAYGRGDRESWLKHYYAASSTYFRQEANRKTEKIRRFREHAHVHRSIWTKPTAAKVSFGLVTVHKVKRAKRPLGGWKRHENYDQVKPVPVEQIRLGLLSLGTIRGNKDRQGHLTSARAEFVKNALPSEPLPRVNGVSFQGEYQEPPQRRSARIAANVAAAAATTRPRQQQPTPAATAPTAAVVHQEPVVVQPRRSARIAANVAAVAATTRPRQRRARAVTEPLRRTTRKGAVKPVGFYKI